MHTFLPRSDTLDADEKLGLVNIVATISEALQRHQPGQNLALSHSVRPLESRSIIAVFVQHEMAVSLALGKYAGKQRCTVRG